MTTTTGQLMIELEVGEIVTGMEQLSFPRYTLSDDGDFLRLQWKPGVTIEADDIHSTIAAVTAASPPRQAAVTGAYRAAGANHPGSQAVAHR